VAKKSIIHRELKKLKNVVLRAHKRVALREKMLDKNLDFSEKMAIQEKMQKLKRNTSPSRLTRRCVQCGRPRGVYRKFGLCRVHLREALMRGDIPGGRKASW
jgi:small subunit ribosomal protein S14